jgi:hypothetical protein
VLVELRQGVPDQLVRVFLRAGEEDLVSAVRGQGQLGVARQPGEVLVGQYGPEPKPEALVDAEVVGDLEAITPCLKWIRRKLA